ncbi:UNKNOWN [Stylonychia lemnae]|uniref:Uncharacterized protein n=1 Tax=Stylonychia lemnae TaxID=5949 RepID=A0A078B9X0_STYLE|nr:UNKNOWN [Stylonychia lemnae]|eukprot:CDW90348.1 UNKNOWN [Stylonychia lemnae]
MRTCFYINNPIGWVGIYAGRLRALIFGKARAGCNAYGNCGSITVAGTVIGNHTIGSCNRRRNKSALIGIYDSACIRPGVSIASCGRSCSVQHQRMAVTNNSACRCSGRHRGCREHIELPG